MYARAGFPTSSISTVMWSPEAGLQYKRSAWTSLYERNEFHKYLWTILLSYGRNRFETYSFDISSLCWNIIIIIIALSWTRVPPSPPLTSGAFPTPPDRKEIIRSRSLGGMMDICCLRRKNRVDLRPKDVKLSNIQFRDQLRPPKGCIQNSFGFP